MSQKLEISEELLVNLFCFYRYANLQSRITNNRYAFTVTTLIKSKMNTGISYEDKEGIYALVGLHDIVLFTKKDNKQRINIDFSYFIPNLRNSRVNVNTFELVLSYYFKKNEK